MPECKCQAVLLSAVIQPFKYLSVIHTKYLDALDLHFSYNANLNVNVYFTE